MAPFIQGSQSDFTKVDPNFLGRERDTERLNYLSNVTVISVAEDRVQLS